MSESGDDVPTCTFHPGRETLLSCTRCERPMCPDCLRTAAVGMQCVECVGAAAKAAPNVARELTAESRRRRRPGWVFWTLVAVFLGLCVTLTQMTWSLGEEVPVALRAVAFGTVVVGWVVSLCLHEWAHAFVAFRSGDHSVLGKGYLSLDPRKYVDPLFSLVLPIAFLLMGGIGLPGGAVWIDRANIRSRHRQALVSAAGPAVNIVFGIVCLLLAKYVFLGDLIPLGEQPLLGSTLTYLAWIQFATALLNLLPVPGLDGFGIIGPYLPHPLRAGLEGIAHIAIMVLFFVVLSRPGTLGFLFDGATNGVEWMGVDFFHVAVGHEIGNIRLR